MVILTLAYVGIQSINSRVKDFPKVQVYQVRSLDRPLFIVFAQNSEGIVVTSQTREQGMMERAVSSSLFFVYVIKKRVH